MPLTPHAGPVLFADCPFGRILPLGLQLTGTVGKAPQCRSDGDSSMCHALHGLPYKEDYCETIELGTSIKCYVASGGDGHPYLGTRVCRIGGTKWTAYRPSRAAFDPKSSEFCRSAV